MPGVMDCEPAEGAKGPLLGILGLRPSPEALAALPEPEPQPKVPYRRWKAIGRGVSKLVHGLRRPRTKVAKGILWEKPKPKKGQARRPWPPTLVERALWQSLIALRRRLRVALEIRDRLERQARERHDAIWAAQVKAATADDDGRRYEWDAYPRPGARTVKGVSGPRIGVWRQVGADPEGIFRRHRVKSYPAVMGRPRKAKKLSNAEKQKNYRDRLKRRRNPFP